MNTRNPATDASPHDQPENGAQAPAPADQPPERVVTMPGDPQRAARDIARVGVEGEPAVPNEGPAAVARSMLILTAIVFFGCAMVGLLWSWEAAIVGMAIAALGLVFNPVMIAALLRRKDRVKVLKQRAGEPDPNHRTHEW
jgi:hypothetical protein